MLKVTTGYSSSPYKVPAEWYLAFLRTPKMQEEMTKQVGNIHHWAINSYRCWALQTPYRASMSCQMVYSMVLISYLFNKCLGDSCLGDWVSSKSCLL